MTPLKITDLSNSSNQTEELNNTKTTKVKGGGGCDIYDPHGFNLLPFPFLPLIKDRTSSNTNGSIANMYSDTPSSSNETQGSEISENTQT